MCFLHSKTTCPETTTTIWFKYTIITIIDDSMFYTMSPKQMLQQRKMISGKLTIALSAMEGKRPQKLRKLNNFKRSIPFCSQSALSAILDLVEKEGVPELHNEKQLKEACRAENCGWLHKVVVLQTFWRGATRAALAAMQGHGMAFSTQMRCTQVTNCLAPLERPGLSTSHLENLVKPHWARRMLGSPCWSRDQQKWAL